MNFTSDFLLVLILKGSWEPQCPGAPGAPGAPNHESELCRMFHFTGVSRIFQLSHRFTPRHFSGILLCHSITKRQESTSYINVLKTWRYYTNWTRLLLTVALPLIALVFFNTKIFFGIRSAAILFLFSVQIIYSDVQIHSNIF